MPQSARQSQLHRAIIASTIGAAIEWYDFFLYSTVTGLVFAKLYFPNSNSFTGALQAFGVYAVGFIARPVGGIVFGHFGDRIGRKATLIATLLLMGLATFAVAFVPTYEKIGIWGAVALVVLRFVQGVGVGGEWAGGVLLALEWAGPRNRGAASAWPQFGSPAGLFLANLAVWGFSLASGDQFLAWGWRVPFMLSVLLIGVGLYIRLGVEETPAFAKMAAEHTLAKAPVLTVFTQYPKKIFFIILLRMAESGPYYIFTAFIFSYGATHLGLRRDVLLGAVMAASLLSFVTIPLAGRLADRFGRRRIFVVGAILTGAFALPYFWLLETRLPALIFLAAALSLIPHDLMWGSMGAFVSENFPPSIRYSGTSVGMQLASAITGGPAPLIAAFLVAQFNSGYVVGIYISGCAVLSLIGAFSLTDHTHSDISSDGPSVSPTVEEKS